MRSRFLFRPEADAGAKGAPRLSTSPAHWAENGDLRPGEPPNHACQPIGSLPLTPRFASSSSAGSKLRATGLTPGGESRIPRRDGVFRGRRSAPGQRTRGPRDPALKLARYGCVLKSLSINPPVAMRASSTLGLCCAPCDVERLRLSRAPCPRAELTHLARSGFTDRLFARRLAAPRPGVIQGGFP